LETLTRNFSACNTTQLFYEITLNINIMMLAELSIHNGHLLGLYSLLERDWK